MTVRTLTAGLAIARRNPLSLVPMLLEGVVAAVLVVAGVLPADPATVPAAGVYPMGLFHDLKQNLAFAPGWPVFILLLMASVAARSATLSATFWIAEGRTGSLLQPWVRMLRWSALAIVVLLPVAILYLVGTGVRYAPFIWIAGGLGVFASALLARGAVAMDAGTGLPQTATIPEVGSFLAYGLVLSGLAAAVDRFADEPWAWASLLVIVGPVSGVMLLGWRERLRSGTRSSFATVVLGACVAAAAVFAGASVYDRLMRNPMPEDDLRNDAELALLQGVDSTDETGALSDFDPRDVGIERGHVRILSYAGAGEPYEAEDTRADLNRTASRMVAQLEDLEPPVVVLGHSQASLIMDRAFQQGVPGGVESVVVLAPAPATPPALRARSGTPGYLAGEGFAALLDLVGITPFDIDAPASPMRLQEVEVETAPVARLSIWALGDSVWLDGDWRRTGELNAIALTDHVGVTRNERAFALATRFYRGEDVQDDGSSWRGALAEILRYSFEPWRPDR